MLLGEAYRVKPVFTASKDGQCLSPMIGTVIYVHPKKRFVVLEFATGVRESFYPEQLSDANRIQKRQ